MEPLQDKIGRRDLLRWMASTSALCGGLGSTLLSMLGKSASAEAPTASTGDFEPVAGAIPPVAQHCPQPSVAPPDGATDAIFDIFGNFWSLSRQDAQAQRRLLVLPAQAADKWVADELSGLPRGGWRFLCADEFGYVWATSEQRCMRLDPHAPQAGWLDFSADLAATMHPAPSITAAGVSPSGAATFAVKSAAKGALIEVDQDQKTSVEVTAAPIGIDRLLCNEQGDMWLSCGGKSYRKSAATDAWQRRWEMVDRLSAGDHDLSGDVLNGKFYMAGGQNAGWGYPAVPHVFHELLAFDPQTMRWSTVAELDQPRFYNGTSFLDERIWVVGGYTRDQAYKAVILKSVLIIDPHTGVRTAGPPLPEPLDNPLALHAGGRIYVAGCQLPPDGSALTGPLSTCLLFSIGSGETAWHREPDGPSYRIALAGTVLDDNLYLAVAGKGLGCFDTRKKTWSTVPVAHAARSPQMAAYRGEIWIMGGRDIEHQDAVTIYSPKDATWKAGPDLPRPLAWGAATEIGGRLMVVGGAAGRGYNNRTFLLRDRAI